MADDSSADSAKRTHAIVFELENFTIDGRECLFHASAKAAAGKKPHLNEKLYSRFCVDRTIHQGLTDFITHVEGSADSADSVTEAAQTEAGKLIGQAAKSPRSEFEHILKHFSAKGVKFGAVSTLPEDIATALITAVDCEKRGIQVVSSGSARGRRLSTESWRKCARALKVRPYHCIAVCTSAAACRSAIAANMVCVAVPDRFTKFQDFGGVNAVLDSFDTKAISKIFDAMND